jgi:subtilase family serine protease
LWAGFMADVNQIRASNHFPPAGYINPFLFTVVYTNSKLYKSDFHDITTGNNGWPAGKGWDAVTGLGSFNVPNLAKTLGNTEGA